jgi:hypothetical protein
MKTRLVVITLTILAAIVLTGVAGSSAELASKVAEPSAVTSGPTSVAVLREYTLPFPEGRVFRPVISGDWVVGIYNTNMNNQTATAQVLVYNLSTKQLQTIWPSGSGWPHVDGNLATWTGKLDSVETYSTLRGGKNQRMPSNLVVHDLKTGVYYCPGLRTGTAEYPIAGGKYVTFVGTGQIILVDMETGVQWEISDRSTGSKNYNPAISGDYVTWTDVTENDTTLIQAYQISTGKKFTIESEPGVKCGHADTDGRTIVWSGSSIQAYDIATGQRRLFASGHFPDIDDGVVVYMKDVKGGPAIYGKCVRSGQEFRISKGFADQGPCVSGNRVTWVKDNVIYCAELDRGDKKPIAKPLSSKP